MLQLDDIWTSDKPLTLLQKRFQTMPVYQSGYVLSRSTTEKQAIPSWISYKEVGQGFSTSLLVLTSPDGMAPMPCVEPTTTAWFVMETCGIAPHLKTFYDKFPYTSYSNNEPLPTVLYTIFAMLGVGVPQNTSLTQEWILVLKTTESIYIFELKYKKDVR